MDYDTLMMQRAGTEPASGNSPLPSPRKPQVCGGPGPDSLALSVNHLGEHEAVLIEIQPPFDEVTLGEDMAASASWAVRHRESLRAQRRVPGQILAEMTEWLRPLQHPLRRGTSPPAQARGHHVVMNGTIMFCSGWQGSLTPAKPLQIHDLVSTTAATWVLGVARRRQPPMTFSKDDHLRLDAAAVVVDLLWSWAPLHSGWGTMYLCL